MSSNNGSNIHPARVRSGSGIRQHRLTITADNRILFYTRDREALSFLSNFSATPILLDGLLWPTVEHFYQAQKSFDPDYRRTILCATRPGIAKNLGADPTNLPRRRSRRSWFAGTGGNCGRIGRRSRSS